MRVLFAIAVLVVAPAAVADDIYVQIPGIDGTSQDPAHVNWIVALSMQHGQGISCTVGGGGGGQSCSNPSFSEVSLLKSVDRATPLLSGVSAAADNLGTVVIEVCAVGASFCSYRLELENSIVTSLSMSGAACVDPGTCGGTNTESFSIFYTRITTTFTPTDSKGGPGTPVSSCWDLLAQKSC